LGDFGNAATAMQLVWVSNSGISHATRRTQDANFDSFCSGEGCANFSAWLRWQAARVPFDGELQFDS